VGERRKLSQRGTLLVGFGPDDIGIKQLIELINFIHRRTDLLY